MDKKMFKLHFKYFVICMQNNIFEQQLFIHKNNNETS